MKKLLATAIICLPLAACYTSDPMMTGSVVRGTGSISGMTAGGILAEEQEVTTATGPVEFVPRPARGCGWDDYHAREVCYY